MNFRVGFGFDVHPLEQGRAFQLGGINIPHHSGATGHSDADVLLHALCDALLGAAGLPDIGHHFPNNSPEYKNIDSKILLQRVMELLGQRNYKVNNVDCTVVLEEPKINPFIAQMKTALAPLLFIEQDAISIKATTNERLGYVGRKEGVCAYAVVVIVGQ